MSCYPQVQLASPSSVYGQWANKLFDLFIAPIVRLRPFQRAYSKAKKDPSTTDLWTKVLIQLNTQLAISEADLSRIPKTGPLIIVANHPHGIMDGVILGSLMHRVRDDFKIIMNEATTMPGLEDGLFFVSIFGTPRENAKKNIQVTRQALEWLKAGHAIVVFPAGEISAISSWNEKVALDNTWNTSMIRLSMGAKAPILPLFIVGQNDNLFLKLGLIHPLFRTLQIGRVTNHLFGEVMTVRAAHLISSKVLDTFKDDVAKADFVRAKLYSLMSRQTQQHRVLDISLADVSKTNVTQDEMARVFEVLYAQPSFKIHENGAYSVLLFNQQQLLAIDSKQADIFSIFKDELGRLRELTFREVGEGSGQMRDLDQFDEYYSHLTLWDREQKQLLGAYRLAFADEIVPQYGIQGLYTALQFEYNPHFFATIGPAIELSRAFIIKTHQKNHMGLSMLLGGLGQLLVMRPHIRSFFGAVSISFDEFQSTSKKLILDFLAHHHGHNELSSWVKAKNPPQLTTSLPLSEWQRLLNTIGDLPLLNTVVSSIEADGKGVPPLIWAYLSLMGRFIAFDHDTGFNSIDSLLVINMEESARQNNVMMRRMMGKKNFEAYLSQVQV